MRAPRPIRDQILPLSQIVRASEHVSFYETVPVDKALVTYMRVFADAEKHIFWFQVTVYDARIVQVRHATSELHSESQNSAKRLEVAADKAWNGYI